MNLAELTPLAADEEKAFSLVESILWPNGAVCPHCGEDKRVNKLPPQRTKASKKHPEGKPVYGLWKCYRCRKQFTVRVGTIFEDSHIPLGKWLLAIHSMCSSKKGISAAQLQRELGLTYKSAWHMCHRVRVAMTGKSIGGKLGGPGTSGIVEADETYVGGKLKNNMHKDKTEAAGKKHIVLTLVEREGRARTFVIPDTGRETLKFMPIYNVEGTAHIVTDGHQGYKGIARHFASHSSVDHNKEFVRGIVHTNFAESYHSLLKRGIVGTFHHISEKHLPRYLREFEFRWNSRKETDGERTEAAIRGAEGKRLMYASPVRRLPHGR